MTENNKHKHLEMIQGVVNRMAQNSFLLKGWCSTLVIALFALGPTYGFDGDFVVAALPPVIIFWFLDAYYLQMERLFRALYDQVRIVEDSQINYSMDTKDLRKGKLTFWSVLLSKTLIVFYPAILALIFTTKIGQ